MTLQHIVELLTDSDGQQNCIRVNTSKQLQEPS